MTPVDESLAAYSNGGGIVELTSSVQVPALPQNDFQLQTGPDDMGQDDGEGAAQRGNLAAPTRKPARSSTTAALAPLPQRGERKRSHSNRPSEAPPTEKRAASLASGLATGPQTATNRPMQMASQQDNYEAALSTEQTPSQSAVPRQPSPSNRNEQHTKLEAAPDGLSNGGKHTPEDGRRFVDEQFNDQLEGQLDSSRKSRAGTAGSQQAMQGPYELAATLQGNRNNYKKKLAQLQSHELKIEPTPSSSLPPTDSSEELMTSYTRVPQNQATNYSQALLRGQEPSLLSVSAQFYNKSAESSNSSTGVDSDELSDSTRAHLDGFNSAPQGPAMQSQNSRAYPGSLPLEMLLGELLKLSPTARPLVDAQLGLEQPANSRPQYGILQQLRSLPGPLLALFQQQQQLGGNQANSAGTSSAGQQGGGDFYANYHHLQQPNHDTSESAQHYQRISMSPYSDIQSLVARSLRTTNPLPAFPPPKGVMTTWVPPNMGGVSILQDAASTNSADFVASETAGFVRGAQDPGLQMAASDVSRQRDQQVPSNESSSSGQNYQTAVQAPKAAETAAKLTRDQPVPAIDSANSAHTMQPPATGADNSPTSQQTGTLPVVYTQQAAGEVSAAGRRLAQPAPTSQLSSAPAIAPNGVLIQRYINQYRLQPPVRQMQRSDSGESGQISRFPTGTGLANLVGPDGHQQLSLANNRPQAIQSKLAQDALHQRTTTLVNSPPLAFQLNSINSRVRRSIGGGASVKEVDREEEDSRDDQEEYSDSSPLSIVTPDGRPLSGDSKLAQRLASSRQTSARTSSTGLDSASSQRETNHADADERAPINHYAAELSAGESGQTPSPSRSQSASGHRDGSLQPTDAENERDIKWARKDQQWRRRRRRGPKESQRGQAAKAKRKSLKLQRLQKLETADSRLMSKLLGVASTNDELEDDFDGDDEESARERRKEELEDAEFGISNDDRSNSPPSSISSNADIGSNADDINDANQENQDVSRLTQDHPATSSVAAERESAGDMPPIRSAGSTDSGAYARRQQQQQRSDVEFYGHPGEETRQLKYGILGSGNYEVVNGGIYPDIDESTAAVNSVANYVRRPGGVGGDGGVLLVGLPKLINSVAATAAAADENRQTTRPRLGRPGFMWGASATSPAADELNGHTLTNNPLLDMLDPAAHQATIGDQPTDGYFNPNLLGTQYLGSSGTSARTTHLSREGEPTQGNDLEEGRQKSTKTKRKRRPKQRPSSNGDQDEGYNSSTGDLNDAPTRENQDKSNNLKVSFRKETMTPMETLNDANNRIRSTSSVGSNDSPSSHSTGRKMNQFYSYQILPSKKVTIFSDQDLDSAPSDIMQQPTRKEPSNRGHL